MIPLAGFSMRHPRPLFPLLAAAALLRVLAVIPPFTDWDENWVGVAAVNVLKGIFPYFFYGQPYMGSIESFLHAAVLWLASASRWSLKTLPVLFGVVFVYLTYLLALRLFDRTTAYLAAIAAAFPSPVLLGWTLNARLHYGLTPLLGVLLFLVLVKILRRREQPTPHLFMILGLLSGLIWWNNYIGIIYLVPVAGLLLAARFRRSLSEGLRYALPAFLIGSFPFWFYHLQIGTIFLSPKGTWAPREAFLPQLQWFWMHTFPSLLGVPVPQDDPTVEWTLRALLVGIPLVAGLAYTGWRWSKGSTEQAVLPLVLLSMAALAAVSVYGEGLLDRYIFPLFAVIPLILGAGFNTIRRWSRIGAWGMVGLLAAVNVWASLGQLSWVRHPDRLERFRQIQRGEAELLGRLRALGLTRNYGGDALNFLSGGALVFSTETEDPHPPFAWLVDGSEAPGYVSRGPSPGFEAGLAALGVRYQIERLSSWWIYHDFSLPHTRYREILPHGWSAIAEENPHLAMAAFDRDIDTLWASAGGQRPGSSYVLDLNRVETVGMIAWIPHTFYEAPRGIEIATSLDGYTWTAVVRVPTYAFPVYWSGTHPFLRLRRPRVEVRFPATPARFLKLTQLGDDRRFNWSIRELFVFMPLDSDSEPDYTGIDEVARDLLEKRVSRVYGDHWVLARLRLASKGRLPVLPVNTYIDNHGRTDLYWGWKHPPNYEKLDRLRLSETVAVVLESWMGTSDAFEQIIREAGYTFRKEAKGEYLIYTAFTPPALPTRTPLPREGWRVWASAGHEMAHHAVDGDLGTRWTTGGAQRPGMWFTVDLGAVTAIDAIELRLGWSRHDYPRGIEVAVSKDGERWEALSPTTIRSGRLYWGGTHALRRGVEIMVLVLPPTPTRYVKLIQAGQDSFYDWSIHELHIYPAR